MKNPPILVSVIGFFAALAGFGYLFFGLRVVGFDWFGALGDLPAFEHVGLWGWLAIATGIIWLLAAFGLWALQPWARLFAMIIAGFALFEAVLAFFQFPGTGVAFGMAIMPALILWYLSTAEVKAAFGMAEPAAVAPAPVAAPPPVAAPVAFAAATAAETVASKPVEAPVAAGAASAADEPVVAHHMNVEDVEGIGPASGEKLATVGIKTTDDLLDGRREAVRSREDRRADGDQWQAHRRVGRQGRSHAGPGRGAAVQRPARGRRRGLPG